MPNAQPPTPFTIEGDPRLSFLGTEKGQKRVPLCRLPGCGEGIIRKPGPGRTKWFHSDGCSREFSRRRRVLQDMADELAARWASEDITYRERKSVEWDLRRILGMRAAYVGPTDWLDTTIESKGGASEALVKFADECKTRRIEHKRQKDPCPVCEGTGDFRRYLGSASDSPLLNKRRAYHAQAIRVVVELRRFLAVKPSLQLVDWVDDAEQYVASLVPNFTALVKAAESARRDRD